MEEGNNETSSKKRVRDYLGSDTDVYESKRVRIEPLLNSAESEQFNLDVSKSPEINDIKNDILDILESDAVSDRVPNIQYLDSLIRSFEEEILRQAPASYSGESQPDLGYLLEASDNDLGLPPAPTEETPKDELANYDSFEFENEIPSYDSFGFGLVEEIEDTYDGQYVALGGLLEYTEASEFLWRPESLPAV